MSRPVALELLADITGYPGPGKRALGRDEAGAWYLVEITPGGERRCLSDPVTVDLAHDYAVAVLAGDDRTITKSQARLSMAVLIAGVCFLQRHADRFQQDGAVPPEGAVQPPGDRPPAPGGAPSSSQPNPGPRS